MKKAMEKEYIPLSIKTYGVRIIDVYPCGCKAWVEAYGSYTHFVNPNCKFDSKKIGTTMIRGYNYVTMDRLKELSHTSE